MSSYWVRVVTRCAMMLPAGLMLGLGGCGGSSPTALSEPGSLIVTQSDIVLPSSVQVVTAN